MGGPGEKQRHAGPSDSESAGTRSSGLRQSSVSSISSPTIQSAPESGPSSTVPARRARARVLLVDANVSGLANATRALSRLGFAVTACHDPTEALALHQNNPSTFDATVASALVMRRAPAAIRAALTQLDRPVVVLADARYDGSSLPATRVLPSPYTMADLAVAIDEALAASSR